MQAVLIPEPKKAELVEVAVPEPGEGEALLRVLATGICGSDVHGFLGEHPFRIPPVITGHEVAAEVVEIRGAPGALRVGDRVAVEPQVSCGECPFCASGDYNLCRRKRVLGTPDWTGSFAEYVTAPFASLYRIPGDFDAELGALVEPLAVAVHSLRRGRVTEGESFAVLGVGTIGLMHAVALSVLEPSRLICSDVKDANLRIARAIGATGVVNPGRRDAAESILELTEGRGVDVCFAVYHSPQVIDTALRIVRPKGRIVVVAVFPEPVSTTLSTVQLNEIEMLGTVMYTREDYERTIELAGRARDSLRRLVTHRITLAELPRHLHLLGSGGLPEAIKVMAHLS
jgi:L-iditol 2-dehydrogenase